GGGASRPRRARQRGGDVGGAAATGADALREPRRYLRRVRHARRTLAEVRLDGGAHRQGGARIEVGSHARTPRRKEVLWALASLREITQTDGPASWSNS